MMIARFLPFLAIALAAGCQSDSGIRTELKTTAPKPEIESKSNIDINRNLNYTADDDRYRQLDLYLPKGKKGEPLLIFIHGGAWMGGDKSLYKSLGERFANDGLAVSLLNYRLSSDGKTKNPDHVKDAAAAYAWLANQASKYGYDPAKIFVSGHSAGAHNSAMMATGDFLQKAGVTADHLPKGFIGLEGIYDIAALNKKYPTYKDWFLAKAFGDEKDWLAGSPTLLAPVLTTPWLVVQSTQDQLVDESQADEFVDHLKKAKIKVDYWKKPLGLHDEVMEGLLTPESELAKKIVKFANGDAP